MKRELTLTDIAGYLDHTLLGQHLTGAICWIDVKFIAQHGIALARYNPVLRPMSDLYVEITDKDYNDGHPFVPLVELAKIAGIGKVDVLEDECEGTFSVGISQYICDDYAAYDFKWSDDRCSFVLTGEDSNNALEEYGNYRLFDLLHRLKLDFRGQIDAGLAVSVHDLKRNPYEAANN